MSELEEAQIDCPYCGEVIGVLLDPSGAGEEYTEDCQVCCRPIVFTLSESTTGELYTQVRREDD